MWTSGIFEVDDVNTSKNDHQSKVVVVPSSKEAAVELLVV